MAITHASKTRSVSSSSLPAVLWALAGSFAFTLVYSSAWLSHGQIEPLQIIFLRYAGGAALALIIMLAMERSLLAAKSPRPSLHFVRALTGSLGELCVISAPLYISLPRPKAYFLSSCIPLEATIENPTPITFRVRSHGFHSHISARALPGWRNHSNAGGCTPPLRDPPPGASIRKFPPPCSAGCRRPFRSRQGAWYGS